jgi:ACT domain-containing protein
MKLFCEIDRNALSSASIQIHARENEKSSHALSELGEANKTKNPHRSNL